MWFCWFLFFIWELVLLMWFNLILIMSHLYFLSKHFAYLLKRAIEDAYTIFIQNNVNNLETTYKFTLLILYKNSHLKKSLLKYKKIILSITGERVWALIKVDEVKGKKAWFYVWSYIVHQLKTSAHWHKLFDTYIF